MTAKYEVLATRIATETQELAHIVQRAERALQGAMEHPEHQDAFMDSCALNLHDFYCGVERRSMGSNLYS